MAKQEIIEVKVISIKELSYSFKSLGKGDLKDGILDTDKLMVTLGIKFNKIEDANTLLVYPSVIYRYTLDEDGEHQIMSIHALFEYEINTENKKFELSSGDTFELDDDIMKDILSETFSTIRGMIAVKTAGNYLAGYPLQLFEANVLCDGLLKNIQAKGKTQKHRKVKNQHKNPD